MHSNQLKNLKQLTGLRKHFKNYIEILTDDYRISQEQAQEIQEKAIQESA
jgi:hypothetical protein